MLFGLALLSATAPLATDMYLPGLPVMSESLGTSTVGIQLTLTTFMAGLGVGQLIVGPLSDGWGRRRLLLAGTVVLALSSALCATAPTVEVLIAARLIQGFSGGTGIVLARAVIADRARGNEAARLFSVMMIIGGVAPIVAPLLGGVLLGPIGWRGIFWVLTGLAVLMIVAVLTVVPETLPPERRHSGGLAMLARNFGTVIGNRRFVGYAATFALGFGAMFSYISASPFVVQEVLGMTPGQFSLIFAANSVGLVAGNIVNTRLIGRFEVRDLLRYGVTQMLTAGVLLVLAVLVADTNRWLVLPLLFLVVSSLGFVMGNATALAQGQVPKAAGTGSAVMGASQFGLAALVSPLVGLGGEDTALPMALAIAISAALSMTALLTLTRERA
ncbi:MULTISPECIES: multidrug effflux MFS transporter [Rhodococcus]|jgi:DHA1 family bicyclomycin/chloramphenicol resistance-like MFS transporter|nr:MULTISPECIES: multidrug effflux MFS transporter [Rhodococcus]AKE89750.1 MFS transporter [Rhodococcus aetherivorans]ANZ25530.1 Bcr/CflA family drug resistance efflux transporter [Rhodococcus sp. WB1]KDE13866.1 MFS transporter [Rhodococcus aetherivorans]MBC2587204.1 multidrug effflux MFS transporter [Rhodococcus aetherivorans]MDV6291662.1 multidrug effflux MFS transporter [Rhodococcus aetherivorans]